MTTYCLAIVSNIDGTPSIQDGLVYGVRETIEAAQKLHGGCAKAYLWKVAKINKAICRANAKMPPNYKMDRGTTNTKVKLSDLEIVGDV
jgi:hypothetical protein